uniref:Uncharacterized protein n=1 Tax=Siphoviridae sp. cteLh2 TaxID=2825590 RepID=A0A8S5U5X3_9CAUD|nr:MAG TPA: hypothetical protein [Siphoviridae sp. cteLh2]
MLQIISVSILILLLFIESIVQYINIIYHF